MVNSARAEAIKTAHELISMNPLYLDTETTGIGPHDNILEIAIIDHQGEVLMDTLVNPVGKISPEAFSIHGIDSAQLLQAPDWNQVWSQVEPILAGRLVGIYNAEFDLRMMEQSHRRHWMQWVLPHGMSPFCIMRLYAKFYGQWDPRRGNYRWHSLDAAGRQCGIHLPNSHRAKDDALLTQSILNYIAAAG